VVLAAGKGTRMKSSLPKVLHTIAGRPMLGHVLATAQALSAERTVVVVAHRMDSVAQAAKPAAIAIQQKQLGTGDAVKAARDALKGFGGDVLVLWSRNPVMPDTHATRLAELTDGTLRYVDDANVLVMLDQPEQTATEIGVFLTRWE